jgi:hypothetical protein
MPRMQRAKQELKFRNIYFNPDRPYSFSGNTKKFSGFLQWLEKQPAWSLHRPIIRQYKRRRIIAAGINHIWEMDLMDLIPLKYHNNRNAHLMVVICSFSKKLDIIPIKNRKTDTIIEAFERLIGPEGRTWGMFGEKPFLVRSDKAGEFTARKFIAYLRSKGIYSYFAQNPDTKSSIVERAIRTIRSRIYRYMSHKNTKRYIDVLSRLVASYNKTYHSSIKMRPIDVTFHNQAQVRENLYGFKDLRKSYLYTNQLPQNRKLRQANDDDLNVGDYVRISKYKSILTRKGYSPNFTREIFRIIDINQGRKRNKRALFTLIDQKNNVIEGSRFYREELSRVARGPRGSYKRNRS